MVMFYVKDKVSGAKDGYEVAGMLKDKIGNEEGFFEFGMLKVEPYSKYHKLRNLRYMVNNPKTGTHIFVSLFAM